MSEALTTALRAWAEKKGINPAEFGRRMGYSYAHAHGLLRGERAATMETLGRLLLVYGAEAAEISEQAKLLNDVAGTSQAEPVKE